MNAMGKHIIFFIILFRVQNKNIRRRYEFNIYMSLGRHSNYSKNESVEKCLLPSP